MKPKPRVAILADYAEEGWPSMDIVAQSIFESIQSTSSVNATWIRPTLPRFSGFWRRERPLNFERLLGRFWHYPSRVRSLAEKFDVFHITDHSYSQLALALPAGKCLITCHDLDTFRCLPPVNAENRPWWFRRMMRETLAGMQRAGHVACVSEATAAALRTTGWVPGERISVIPNGIPEEFFQPPRPESTAWVSAWLRQRIPEERPLLLLHVGSTIARKRIDNLLRVFAGLRQIHPELRLLRVGGPFSVSQEELAQSLGLTGYIHHFPFLEREQLRAVYDRALLLLQPSEAEGFGLPVAEALACGTPVVASDLTVFREVGGSVVHFCAVGDTRGWVNQVSQLILQACHDQAGWTKLRNAGRVQSSRYQWSHAANLMVNQYQNLHGILG